MGFVDLHSHILYGIDDGATTLEESVRMLTIARDQGTTEIVATPHANGRYLFDPTLIDQRIAELSETAGIQVYPGCDFHLQSDNILDALAFPEKYTINHRTYLLVEFPDFGAFHAGGDILRRLLDAGMVPIITHPERNSHLQRAFDLIAEWNALGCYVQVTAASYMGLFGKGPKISAQQLVQRGLVHFIASDAHDTQHRTPNLREAYARLADDFGEEVIRPMFVDNPRAVVRGDTFDFEFPTIRPRPKRWYRLWS